MAFGSLGGFTAAAAKVVLGVESTQFNTELAAAEATFARTAAGMAGSAGEIAERTIRAGVAQERYNKILGQTGAASLEARTALASYIGEMRRLNDVQNQSTASLSRFERGMVAGGVRGMGMGRALAFASNAFLGGAGFVYAVHSATKAASEFQGEMRLLQTQALTSRAEVDRMTAAVKRLAGPLATQPEVLAKGLYRVESAGYRGAAALKVLTTATKGARLGHSDLEATVNALIAAQKSGIRGSQDLGQAMGTLDAIVGAGNTRMEDLTKALASGVIPAAQHAGVDLQGLGAALATLTIHGTPAELAATRLRYSIALLSVQTPKAEKELRSIGLASGELGRKMKAEGLVPALELLSEKLKTSGYDAQQQHAVLERSFGGGRSYTTILDLLKHIDQLRERFNLISKEGTSQMFNSRWQAQVHTAEYAFDRLKASAEVLKIQIGNELLPTTIKMADGISKWLGSAANQARVTRDVKEALHDAGEAAHVFADAMHQAAEVMHVADRIFGGAGHSLKLLVEVMLLRKALGFAKMINHDFLNPLRAVTSEADKAKDHLEALGTVQTRPMVSGGGAVAGAVPLWREGDLAVLDERINSSKQTYSTLRKQQKLAEADAHETNAAAVTDEAAAQENLNATESDGIQTTRSATAQSKEHTSALESETAAITELATANQRLQAEQSTAAYLADRRRRLAQPGAAAATPASDAAYEQLAARYGLPVAEVKRLHQFRQETPGYLDRYMQEHLEGPLISRLGAAHKVPGTDPLLAAGRLSGLQLQQTTLVSQIERNKGSWSSEELQAARDQLYGLNRAIAAEKKLATGGLRSGSPAGGAGVRGRAGRLRAASPAAGARLETSIIGGKLHVRRGDQWFLPTPAEQTAIEDAAAFEGGTVQLRPSARRAGRSTAPLPPSEYVYPATTTVNGRTVRTIGAPPASPEEAAAAQAAAAEAEAEAQARRENADRLRRRATSFKEQARVADEVAVQARGELQAARTSTKLTKAQTQQRAELQSRIRKLNRQMGDLRNGVTPTGFTDIGGVPHYQDEQGNFWRADMGALQAEKAKAVEALGPLQITKTLPQRGQAGAVKELEAQAAAKRKLADASTAAATTANQEAVAAEKVAAARRLEAEQTAASAQAAAREAAEQAAAVKADRLAAEEAAAVADMRKAAAAATSPNAQAIRNLRGMRGEIQDLQAQAKQLVATSMEQAEANATVDSSVRRLTADEIALREARANQGVSEPVVSPLVTERTQGGLGTLRYGRRRPTLTSGGEGMWLTGMEREQSFSRMRSMGRGAAMPFQRLRGFTGSPQFQGNSMAYGGALMMLPMMFPQLSSGRMSGVSNLAMGAGAGIMFGNMLGLKSPMTAGLIGAAFGLKSAVTPIAGKKAGSVVGNIGEGAAVGATIGSIVPVIGTGAGAIAGGILGAGVSLFKFSHHVDRTTDNLMRLSTAASTAGRNLSSAKQAVREGTNQVAYDRVSREQAGAQLKAARTEEEATRKTHAHAAAVLQLKAAEAQFREANQRVIIDLRNLADGHKAVAKQADMVKQKNNDLVSSLVKVGDDIRNVNTKIVGFGHAASIAFLTPAQKAEMFAEKMDKIADKSRAANPKLARTATALANIARQTDKIPNAKMVRIVLSVGIDMKSVAVADKEFQDFLNQRILHPFSQSAGSALGGIPFVIPGKPHWDPTAKSPEGGLGAWVNSKGQVLSAAEQAKLSAAYSKSHPFSSQPGVKTAPLPPKKAPTSASFFHPSEDTLIGHYEEQAAYYQARGNDAASKPWLDKELARLWMDFKRATNDVQRTEVLQAIGQVKSEISSLATKALRNGGLGILPATLQHKIDSAVQSGSKPREIKAYEAAEKWLRTYMSHQEKGSLAYKKADDLLTQYAKKVKALEKSTTSGKSFFSNDPTWLKLLKGQYKAEQTTNSINDDIKAYKAEQTYLKRIVSRAESHHDLKLQVAANRMLASIDVKLAKLTQLSNEQLREMQRQFLADRASFFASFGSNVFTQQRGIDGVHRTMGSGSAPTVNVHQHFPAPPSADYHREARHARSAVAAAMAS